MQWLPVYHCLVQMGHANIYYLDVWHLYMYYPILSTSSFIMHAKRERALHSGITFRDIPLWDSLQCRFCGIALWDVFYNVVFSGITLRDIFATSLFVVLRSNIFFAMSPFKAQHFTAFPFRPSPFGSSPFGSSPFRTSPFRTSPFRTSHFET